MLKRTITGLVILVVLAGFTALRLVSPLFFDVLVLVLSYGAIVEMFMAYKVVDKKFFKLPLFVLPLGFWAIFRWTNQPLIWCLVALLGVFVLAQTAELFGNAQRRKMASGEINATGEKPALEFTQTTMSVSAYPVSLIAFFFGINYLGLGLGFVGIIMVFAVSIFTDVFAYCFGMMLGRKGAKLAPEISPKKSVVGAVFGFVGGLVAGGLGWLMFYHFGWFNALSGLTLGWSIALFAILGACGSLLTQFGDLVASAFKRRVGLKDYGSIFPGHGGIMDRIDGQMFNAVLVYLVFTLII